MHFILHRNRCDENSDMRGISLLFDIAGIRSRANDGKFTFKIAFPTNHFAGIDRPVNALQNCR